jgi:helicase
MKVRDLPLPGYLVRWYEAHGITDLYPPQADCVRKGMFEGKNLLVAIPTASGKTMVAEMAMHVHIRDGEGLYMSPKAHARSKDLQRKGWRRDFDRRFDRREECSANDIIIATSERPILSYLHPVDKGTSPGH